MCAHMAGLAGAWRVYTHCVRWPGHRPAENALAARWRAQANRRRGDASISATLRAAPCEPNARRALYTPALYTQQIKYSPSLYFSAPLPGKKPNFSQIWRVLWAYHVCTAGRKSAMHPPHVCTHMAGMAFGCSTPSDTSRTRRAKPAPLITTRQQHPANNIIALSLFQRSFTGQKAQIFSIWRVLRAYHVCTAGRKSAMHPLYVYTHGVRGRSTVRAAHLLART